jgi:hypothetical protein
MARLIGAEQHYRRDKRNAGLMPGVDDGLWAQGPDGLPATSAAIHSNPRAGGDNPWADLPTQDRTVMTCGSGCVMPYKPANIAQTDGGCRGYCND